MTAIDTLIVITYLVAITAMGILIGKRVKGASDFFMPRRFGKGMMMMHAFGTGAASDQAVIVAAGSFRNGLSGIWFQWLWLFNTPFYWLIAPIFRRFRAVTTADVYSLRFNQSVATLFALLGVIGLTVKIGVLLKGAGALLDAGTSGAVSADLAIPIVALLFVIYGIFGGLAAAIVTDYIQGILTIVFSFIVLPFVLKAIGGIQGIRETVADPTVLSLVAPDSINPLFIATFAALSLVGIVAQPFIMGVCAAGRTEMDGRFGFVAGNLIKRVCTAAWALTGVAALAWYTQQGIALETIDPDRVYGDMAAVFLPNVADGALGLFVAALLAGVMSSCDSFMISSAALFTENIYRPLLNNRAESHYLWVGRLVSALVVVFGCLFAFALPDVVTGLKTWLKIAPMLGLAFWIGLFWRRFNATGAWAVTVTGFLGWYVVSQPWAAEAIARFEWASAAGVIQTSEGVPTIIEPWQIVFYMGAASLAGILASLLSPAPSKPKIQQFHDLMKTPIAPNETISAPCQLPDGVTPADRPSWFPNSDFEIPAPSKTSIVGFAISWIAVGLLIGSFVLLVNT